MTTETGLSDWEQEIADAVAAARATPRRALPGEAEILAAARIAAGRLPAEAGWERGMIYAAAVEAMNYPDPSALAPAVRHAVHPGKHARLGEYWDRTASGCQYAAEAEVAALATSQGQERAATIIGWSGFWERVSEETADA